MAAFSHPLRTLTLLFGAIAGPAFAQPPASEEPAPSRRINLTAPTLGGVQFWTDELSVSGWRIQRNAVTGHCRLLDERDRRRAWGTYDQCREAFEQARAEQRVPKMAARVVVTLHGLGDARGSMDTMCEYLRGQGSFDTVNFSYASTRAEVGKHAAALARVIESFDPEVREIDFVAHSLGCIVVRHYLADATDASTGRRPDRRIRRIVMLGPPNHGSAMARSLAKWPLIDSVWGPSGHQLGTGWKELEPRLATPTCEFAIIAGHVEENRVNPLLQGEHDLLVTEEETRLSGARDFVVIPALHSVLPDNELSLEYTWRFLEKGRFRPEGDAQPIP